MAEVFDDLQGGSSRRSGKLEANDLLSGRAGRPIGFGRTEGDRIATRTLIEGSVMGKHWKDMGRSLQDKFVTQMRISLRNGESIERMAARIAGGTIRGERVPGIMDITRRQARTLTRTATNAVQNRSRLIALQNSDMVKAVQQVSTLDNRTSDICVAFSGQTWDAETLEPIGDSTLPFNGGPPRHFNCRSTLNPVLKSFDKLGFNVGELPPATRASMDGQVAEDITFDRFLRGKTKTFQNKLLGPGRAQLWRDGKITLTQLVDMRGNPLTLSQLEATVGRGIGRPPPAPRPPTPPPPPAPTVEQVPEFKSAKEGVAWVKSNLNPIAELPASPDKAGLRAMAQVQLMLRDRFGVSLAKYMGDPKKSPVGRYKWSNRTAAAVDMHPDRGFLLFRARGLNTKASRENLQKVNPWMRGELAGQTARAESRRRIMEKRLEVARELDDKDLIKIYEDILENKGWEFTFGDFDDVADIGLADVWRNFIHEGGHQLHRTFRRELDEVLQQISLDRPRYGLWRQSVSEYAQTNAKEFLAESFVAYVLGRFDRVHPLLLRAFRKLDKGGDFGYPGDISG